MGNGIIMLHDVGFLDTSVKLSELTTLCSAVGAGLIIFTWLLCGILFGVFLKYFPLLIGVSG